MTLDNLRDILDAASVEDKRTELHANIVDALNGAGDNEATPAPAAGCC